MGVFIAGVSLAATAFRGKPQAAKQVIQRVPTLAELLEKLYRSAQAGNVEKTAERFCRQYPTFAPSVDRYVFGKDSIGHRLIDLNTAAKAFRETRKAHPINFKTIA